MLFLSFLAILASGTHAVRAGPPSERSADLSKCKQYTIQDGDTCLKVGKKNKSTYAQIVSWNRDIPSICSKMKSLIGTSICVSNPSGAFGIPINEHADPSIATAPFKKAESTNVPNDGNVTYPAYRFEPAIDPIPLAKGTRLDCYLYYWLPNVTDDLSADCWALASSCGATPEEFILWNPSLAETNGTCEAIEDADSASTLDIGLMTFINGYTWPCTIAPSQSYCIVLSSATASPDLDKEVQPPTPRAAGEISNCTMWLDVPEAITCDDFMTMNNLQFDEFYEMNPSVGKDCGGLVVGTNYCRSTYPGGRGFGIPGWSSSEPDDDHSTVISTQPASSPSKDVSTNASGETGTTATRPSPVQTGVSESCTSF